MQKQKERVDAWKKKFAMDDKEEDETARRFRLVLFAKILFVLLFMTSLSRNELI